MGEMMDAQTAKQTAKPLKKGKNNGSGTIELES
jgi:hypothetical protein